MTKKRIDPQITERLNMFIREKGWSKSDFSRAIGAHRQNIDRYLKGDSDPSKIVIKLITHGLNTDWLLTGEGEMMSGKPAEKQPVYRSTPGKEGGGAEVSILDLLPERLLQALKDYEKRENVYMMPALGPQMTPEKIKEGDVLLIDPKQDAVEGDWILVSTETGPSIQRYSPSATSLGVVLKLVREIEILRR